MGTTTVPARRLTIGDVEIELFEEGQGAPLLFLHGAQGFHPNHPFVGKLTAQRRVVAPSGLVVVPRRWT